MMARACFAANEPIQGFSSLEVAEALALRRAVSIAKEKDVQRVIVASDLIAGL
jgi:hypothetical protein